MAVKWGTILDGPGKPKAAAVSEAKQWVWEKFGEAMQKDFWLAPMVSRRTSDTSEGGNGEPSKLCTVRVGLC